MNHPIWRYLPVALLTLLLNCSESGTVSGPVNNAPPPIQPGTSQPGISAQVSVTIPPNAAGLGAQAFGTNPLIIQQGQTVVWVNGDSIAHTVTAAASGGFGSGTLNPGQSFSYTFNFPGTFSYYCAIHGFASMNGSVQVEPAAGPSPSPSPSPAINPSPSPSPGGSTPIVVAIVPGACSSAPVRIPTGTTLTWINQDNVAHTVTADSGAFNSGEVGPGQGFSETFEHPGEYHYHCDVPGGAQLAGTVVVVQP